MPALTLRELVLVALEDGASYGMTIVDHIRSNPDARWWHRFALRGRIYSLLHRMENDGYLASFEDFAGITDRGGRPRRRYKLTSKKN